MKPVTFAGDNAPGVGPVNYSSGDDKLQREMERLSSRYKLLGSHSDDPKFKDARHAWKSYKANVWDGKDSVKVALDLRLTADAMNLSASEALNLIQQIAEDEETIASSSSQPIAKEGQIKDSEELLNKEDRRKLQKEKIAKIRSQRSNAPNQIGYGDEKKDLETIQEKESVPPVPQEIKKQSPMKNLEEEALNPIQDTNPTSGTGLPEDTGDRIAEKEELEKVEEELEKMSMKARALLEKRKALYEKRIGAICEFIETIEEPTALEQLEKAIRKAREQNK